LILKFKILIKAMQINANIKIIDVLLANNADLYAANKSGSTAFHEGTYFIFF